MLGKKRIGPVFAALVLTAACGQAEPSTADAAVDAGRSSWTERATMPTSRSEVAVALLDDTVYVAGGYSGRTTFESYDLRSDMWSVLHDLPEAVDHASLVAVPGTLVLTGGGNVNAYTYDPGLDAWSLRQPVPLVRYAAAAVALGRLVYLIGGVGPSPRTLQRYDVASDEWTLLAPMREARDHVGAAVLAGEIYALSGRRSDGGNFTSTEIYDAQRDEWRDGPEMLAGRSGFGVAVLDGAILAAGGELILPPIATLDSVEVLPPGASAWSLVAPLPQPVHGCGAVSWNGRLWIFGGAVEAASANPRVGAVWVYEP